MHRFSALPAPASVRASVRRSRRHSRNDMPGLLRQFVRLLVGYAQRTMLLPWQIARIWGRCTRHAARMVRCAYPTSLVLGIWSWAIFLAASAAAGDWPM